MRNRADKPAASGPSAQRGSWPWACRPTAFTVVELLVVLAVIALLAALILPVLASGKMSAKRIRCLNNLRQLGLAAQMYWDDHEGFAFRYKGISTNGGDIYWFGWLQRGSEGERAFDPTPGALYPYLLGRGVEICPSLSYQVSYFKLKAKGAAYGYGYNTSLSSTLPQPPVPLSRVHTPTEVALLADAAQINTFQYPASPDNPMLEEFYYVNESEPTAHFRHQLRANVLFCDGHVDREKPLPGSLNPILPRERVGRLRADCLRLQ